MEGYNPQIVGPDLEVVGKKVLGLGVAEKWALGVADKWALGLGVAE